MEMLNALAAAATVKLWPILADNAAGPVSGDGANWSVDNFLQSGSDNLIKWGSLIVGILGVVALIVAVYMLVTGLISHGKKQTSWIVVILLFVVGGMMAVGGWSMVANIGTGLNDTMQSWGGGGNGGVVLPALWMLGIM